MRGARYRAKVIGLASTASLLFYAQEIAAMFNFSGTRITRAMLLFAVCLLTCLLGGVNAAQAQVPTQAVYTDSLQNGWQNYGWATLNYSNTSPVHSGSDSISVTTAAYQALYLHHAAQDPTQYLSISFWINGGATGGQPLQVQATVGGQAQPAVSIGTAPVNTWQKVTVGLDKLGVAQNAGFDGFWIQSTSGSAQPAFYVDDITLDASGTVVANSPVTVSVDVTANRHPISPLVYGVCFGSATSLPDLNAPLNRSGGNNMSRYNWQVNADNKDSDYYFESLPPSSGSSVAGEVGDTFFSSTKTAGAQALLTIPMIDWIAKLGPNRGKLSSFSVAKYGPQTATDPYFADAGSGVKADGTNVTGNDPNDADTPNSTAIQQAWVQHLVGRWGTAANGGVKYYLLDNEPSIWYGTHRDVHPNGPGTDEMLSKMISYSAAIKAVDPTALVLGPEEWGYVGYIYSGADQQYRNTHNYQGAPDRAAHGNMDYIPYLLQQLYQHDQTAGSHSLDVLSVHFYPQGDNQGDNEFSDDVSTTTQLLRNRSTRCLWDPNYTAENYINDKVMLIPRLKNWVNTYYPGLQTALTEYNWGAENNINGATTQADIDGILGRENIDMATRWTTPAATTPTYKAMKMYRDYDGGKSTFGDTSVSDSVPNADNLSSFAAVRASDGALTVIVISKILQGDTPITISTAGFAAAGPVQAWQLTSANAITRIADVTPSGSTLTATVPAQSITLYVFPAVADETSQIGVSISGTVYVRRTRIFAGSITLTNNSGQTMNGPFQAVLNGLPTGQTLVNAAGTYKGNPYVTANVSSLAPGASTTVTVLFRNSGSTPLNYIVQALSGTL